MHRSALVFALALTLGGIVASNAAQAAGRVDVSFQPNDELSDIGRGAWDGERNVKALADHFKSLAAHLPDGQTLTVKVLDVNLAGEIRPLRHGTELRVLKGAADWPTMDLRWTLSAQGRTLASGEERLADQAYLMHASRLRENGPLPYETRMIDRWFNERIVVSAR